MVNRFLLLFSFYTLFVIGCATTQASSGFLVGSNVRVLPEGVPKRVGVYQFSGDYPLNIQSTDQFSAGLLRLGFDVVERQHLENVIDELSLQQTGIIAENTRKELGKQLGLEGIFVGSVTGEVSPMWIDSHLNIKLVDIQTGKMIWSATAKDPRILTISLDVKTSIVHTTNQALKMLERDLYNIK